MTVTSSKTLTQKMYSAIRTEYYWIHSTYYAAVAPVWFPLADSVIRKRLEAILQS